MTYAKSHPKSGEPQRYSWGAHKKKKKKKKKMQEAGVELFRCKRSLFVNACLLVVAKLSLSISVCIQFTSCSYYAQQLIISEEHIFLTVQSIAEGQISCAK